MLLRQEDAELVLDPEHGGAIREYRCAGRPLLRSTPDAGRTDPFALACFPLVPYVNRVAHGRFTAGGRDVRLRPNWKNDPEHPLHGQGWGAVWSCIADDESTASLRFDGGGDEWPWRYRAEQHFRLSPRGLHVRLSVVNLSDSPMPAALGLHPYFPEPQRAELWAQASRVWTTDASALPVEEISIPPTWSFAHGRPVSAASLDHCFSGWNGVAKMIWPDRTLTLHATQCQFLHVYTPEDAGFFCIEPQTAATGALNRPAEAHMLSPGKSLEMQMALSVAIVA